MPRGRSFRPVLLDVERVVREGTTKELVPVDRTVCPSCKADLNITRMEEPALFFHGGYGATRRTSTVACTDCGWSLTVAVDETNPRAS
jgi:hypothetical protein